MTSDRDHLSFHLHDDFISLYADRQVDWGFPIGAGNSLGELTFITKYSRLKADGTKERWHETCRRVVEGVYSILKDHCTRNQTPWYHPKAQRAAEDMYDRMFHFKWLPPGRGLEHMGTPFVWEEGSAALQNCSYVSTSHLGPRQPTQPFVRLMEQSMLGIGVGFDVMGVGALDVHTPTGEPEVFVVPDTREGWVDSLDALLRSYFLPGQVPITIDTSQVRPRGAPLKRLGGVAGGPQVLERMHTTISRLLDQRTGESIDSRTITDVMNLIARCVVAGNRRRSATLALGLDDDKDFISLKDWTLEENKERMAMETGWGSNSNNSIIAEVGGDYEGLVDRIVVNGEPGLYFLDLAQGYGRLGDPRNDRDFRVQGCNPCAEQSLEHNELCTLVECFPVNCEGFEDFRRSLKVAYLYAKAVTLMPTHWQESNEVMTRNRRIGCSVTGLAQFAERHGWTKLRSWLDQGYEEVTSRDRQYSEWLGVRESIKMTSVKPSGTVSLLAGVTPGVHWPVSARDYLRRVRYSVSDPILGVLDKHGYEVEPSASDPEADAVVTFPASGPEVRSEREVTVWEKVALAATLQKHWADNMVSATFTFRPDEANEIGPTLRAFDGQLKTMSFLPMGEEIGVGAYPQMPYEAVADEDFEKRRSKVKPISVDALYAEGIDAQGDKYCDTDTCTL